MSISVGEGSWIQNAYDLSTVAFCLTILRTLNNRVDYRAYETEGAISHVATDSQQGE